MWVRLAKSHRRRARWWNDEVKGNGETKEGSMSEMVTAKKTMEAKDVYQKSKKNASRVIRQA